MTHQVGIFGTSGMARECRDIAEALSLEVVFIAREGDAISDQSLDASVITESELNRYVNMPCVIGIGEPGLRKRVASRHPGRRFLNLVHPSATLGHNQRQLIDHQQGLIVCAGVRMTCGIRLGDFCILNLNATVSHDCQIESFVTLSPQACVLGNVSIGADVWIGAGAVIHQGRPGRPLSIGTGCVIGAGAVVLNDCQAYSVYAGVPARKIK